MAGLFGENVPELVLKSVFTKYDADGRGSLTEKEVKTLLVEDLGMNETESDAFTLLMDEDGNKSISFEEFKEWSKGNNKAGIIFDPTGRRFQLLLKAAEYFKEFDVDDNGAIEGEEVLRLVEWIGLNKDKASVVLNEIDRDKNGKISFHEFLKWLRWIPMDEN